MKKIAQRAIELIDVEYEILEAVFDFEEARKPDAPQIREEGNEREPYIVEWGDTDKGEELAEHTVECDIYYHSQQYAPLGRNAAIAEWMGDKVKRFGLRHKLQLKPVMVFMKHLVSL